MLSRPSPNKPLPVEARLFSPGRKRILTIDGGGVRGIVAIAFLKEMERELRQHTAKPDLVLADVFDMIAGTSVGSMLATMIALGKETAEIEAAFRELAPKIFSGRLTLFGQKRFSAVPLVNGVRSFVKDATLGSDRLLTGLAIVAKRVDTDSVWVMTNNPRMPYYHDGPDWDGNRHYKLEMLIRASTAAPFLFTPTEITIHTDRFGNTTKGWFVDGGVSPHNNPALLMLMMAGMPSYNLNWTLSPDDLLMISVGTGLHRSPIARSRRVIGAWAGRLLGRLRREDIEEAAFCAQTLRGLIGDSALLALKVMQSVSNPRFSWKINSEVNAFEGELLLQAVKGVADHHDPRGVLRFQRYDLPLEAGRLVKPEFDVGATQAERLALHAIDEPANIDKLYALASEAAGKQVSMLDFEGFV
jgi:predicted acylesterase/phospholipase RssA